MSNTDDVAEAKRRARENAAGMVAVLAEIAGSPEPARGSATRVRAAGLVLAVADLIALPIAATPHPVALEANQDE